MSLLFAWFRTISWPRWLVKLVGGVVAILAVRSFWRKQGADDLTAEQNKARLKSAAAAKKDYDDAQSLSSEALAQRLTARDSRDVH